MSDFVKDEHFYALLRVADQIVKQLVGAVGARKKELVGLPGPTRVADQARLALALSSIINNDRSGAEGGNLSGGRDTVVRHFLNRYTESILQLDATYSLAAQQAATNAVRNRGIPSADVREFGGQADRLWHQLKRIKEETVSWIRNNPRAYGAQAVLNLLAEHPTDSGEGFERDIRNLVVDTILETDSSEGGLARVSQVQEENSAAPENLQSTGEGAASGDGGDQTQQRQPLAQVSNREGQGSRFSNLLSGVAAGVGGAAAFARTAYSDAPAEVRARIDQYIRDARDRAINWVAERVRASLQSTTASSATNQQQQQPPPADSQTAVETGQERTTGNMFDPEDSSSDVSGDSGDGVDTNNSPVKLDRAPVLGAGSRRGMADAPDGMLGKRGGTVENTIIAKRVLPPNLVTQDSGTHVQPFPHDAAIEMVSQLCEFAAVDNQGSSLFASTKQVGAAKLCNPPTYPSVGGSGARQNVRVCNNASPWNLTATVGVLIPDPAPSTVTNSQFVGMGQMMQVIDDGTIDDGVEHEMDEKYRAACPPVSGEPDRWYYLSQAADTTTGVYSEVILSRLIRDFVSTRKVGGMWPILARLVAELGRSSVPITKDGREDIGGMRISMRDNDRQDGNWRERQNEGYYNGDTWVQTPLANLMAGNHAEYQALMNVDAAVIGLERVMKSHFGDGTKKFVGQDAAGAFIPAIPTDWNLNDTCLIPITHDMLDAGATNYWWTLAHFGLTTIGGRQVVTHTPDEVGDGVRDDLWRTGLGIAEFAGTAIRWPEATTYKHVLFVLMDAAAASAPLRITCETVTTNITPTGPRDLLIVRNNFFRTVVVTTTNDTASRDRRPEQLATIQRFDTVYKTTAHDIRQVVGFFTRFGFWTNQLPKITDEQGADATDFACDVNNIRQTINNTAYSSWNNTSFRQRYINPNMWNGTSSLSVWAHQWLAYQKSTDRPIPTAQHFTFRGKQLSVAVATGFTNESIVLVRTATGGGPSVPIAKEWPKIARAMGIIRPKSPRLAAANTDWLEFWSGVGITAADATSYTFDDLAGVVSMQVMDYKSPEYGIDNFPLHYRRDGKLNGPYAEKVSRLACPEGCEWKWSIKDASTSNFYEQFADNAVIDRRAASANLFNHLRQVDTIQVETYRFTLPKRVTDACMFLMSSGAVRQALSKAVLLSAVDFSMTGAVKSTTRIGPAANGVPLGEVVMQMITAGMMHFATPSDLKVLSRVQNTGNRRRTTWFNMGFAGTQATPFTPAEYANLNSATNDPQFVLTQRVPATYNSPTVASASDATQDLRDNTRLTTRIEPHFWLEMGIKQSDQLARMYGGTNPAMPLTVMKIPENATQVFFDAENVGVGDPQRVLMTDPDMLN